MKCTFCNTTDHEPGAKFCHVCGNDMIYSLSRSSGQNKQNYEVAAQRILDAANGSISFIPLTFLLYSVLLTIFTIAASMSALYGLRYAFDGVLWPRLFFLGLTLFGYAGSSIYLIRFYKNHDKDDLLGQPVVFIIDFFITTPSILLFNLPLWLKLIFSGFLLLLIIYALVLRKRLMSE